VRALVTGDQGFLGRHFSAALAAAGYDVVGCDVRTGPEGDCRYVFGQISQRYDLVVHCAAVVGGRAGIDGSPLETAVNLELDAALFRWAAIARPGRVVYISSSAAYPVIYQTHPGHKLREGDVYIPHDVLQPDQVYGWTKIMGEVLSQQLRRAGVPVTVVRPFSGYGTDQDDSYPFPAFVSRALRHDDPFEIWCGQCVRDFVHVDDVVGATLAAVAAGAEGPVNICTGVPTSFNTLARMVCQQAGYEPELAPDPSAPTGVFWRVGSPVVMHSLYMPKIPLAVGIGRALHERTAQPKPKEIQP
jgi:nucleoside-diphosphate-sugar epimerase